MGKLTGKVALVTGASSGIGLSAVTFLLEEGATVYGAARRLDRLQDVEKIGGHAIEMDITKEEDITSALAKINNAHGSVDILINNAGYGSYGSVEEVPIDEARRQFEVNLFGLGSITQKVLPQMREKKYGKIVNISSMAGKIYMPMGAWYHATKHALEGWSDSLRLEVAQFGIDVVIVEPGGIQTEWGGIAMDSMQKYSGKGPYARITNGMTAAFKETYENGKGSHPDVIGKIIVRAVTAKHPKTRYAKGYMAKFSIFSRWLLSDKMFDGFLKSQI
ncbi:MAG: NAD(P)-dependent dehydrogenase (short-subunit alcohol dehydrogenase family) [Sphingobacteriales bacterium]|jgi:NAD(P)-dependent dehydrogenase (short-subunit alcohol dehydrogenase family)